MSATVRSRHWLPALGVCPLRVGWLVLLVSWIGCPSGWLGDGRRFWSEFGKFSEILGCGGEQELVLSSTRSPQSEATQLQDTLEMGKQHFNLLSFSARLVKGRRIIQGSGHVSTIFINVTRDLARWRVRAASLLEWAPVTIQFAGPVQPRAPIMHCAGGLQCLALRTRIQIALSIEVEVRP